MSSRILEEYPNPHALEDERKVRGAVITLWVIAGLNLLGAVMGFLLMQDATKAQAGKILFWSGLIGGGIYGLLAALVQFKRSEGAVIAALVFLSLGLLGNALSLNLIGIALNSLFLFLVGRSLQALRNIRNRVLAEEQENPLVDYYHKLIHLIVRVLRADGRVTPEEVAHFNRVCEGFHISPMERKILFDRAMRDNQPLSDLAQAAVRTGRRLGVANPEAEILNALVAAAGADRVLAPEERQVLDKVAITLGYDPGMLDARLAGLQQVPAAAAPAPAAQQANPPAAQQAAPAQQAMTRAQALQVLGLPESASPDQIREAFNRAMAELDPNRYVHLGQQVMNSVAAQRQYVLAAGQVLLGHGAG